MKINKKKLFISLIPIYLFIILYFTVITKVDFGFFVPITVLLLLISAPFAGIIKHFGLTSGYEMMSGGPNLFALFLVCLFYSILIYLIWTLISYLRNKKK